jgi:hypothetical protein
MSSSSDRKLAISIARCDLVSQAIGDSAHPCHKVVSFQKDSDDRHIPEPWFGNVSNAQVLFVASNPSIDQSAGAEGENYPRAGWPDEKIGEWFVRRVDQTWDEVPVTFRNPKFKDFNWRCIDGEYRGAGKSNSPQTTWNNLHKVAEQLLGSEADPARNYALTEIVHCKSPMAIGVPEASSTCSEKWLPAIIHEAEKARCIVFLGANVRPWVRQKFAGIAPSDFGAPVESGGSHVAIRDSFVGEWSDADGTLRKIVFCFLPHPTSSQKGGRTFGTRFGSLATSVLNDIVKGRRDIPETSQELHRLFRG